MSATVAGKRGAGGRPPLARRGDVEERLLAAATKLFLSEGFEGTSCDQVALDAHAGKASIYARYANKTALLQAVVDANLRRLSGEEDVATDADAPLRVRLSRAGEAVIDNVLRPEAIGLLRLIVTEAPRLQGAALDADAILQRIGIERLTRAIRARAPDGDAEAAAQASALAAGLLDAALLPALARALLGADPAGLRAGAAQALAAWIASMDGKGALAGWD